MPAGHLTPGITELVVSSITMMSIFLLIVEAGRSPQYLHRPQWVYVHLPLGNGTGGNATSKVSPTVPLHAKTFVECYDSKNEALPAARLIWISTEIKSTARNIDSMFPAQAAY